MADTNSRWFPSLDWLPIHLLKGHNFINRRTPVRIQAEKTLKP